MHAVLWLLCLLCAVTVSEAFTITDYRTLRARRDASSQQRLELYSRWPGERYVMGV